MNMNQLDIEVTYLKKGYSAGGLFYTERTLEGFSYYETGDKFVLFQKSLNQNDEKSGDQLAILIPVEDVINIKLYKR